MKTGFAIFVLFSHGGMKHSSIAAFLQTATTRTTARRRGSSLWSTISTGQQQQQQQEVWNPLGPPSFLASLRVGEGRKVPLLSVEPSNELLYIERLSHHPDLFVVRNFVSSHDERHELIQSAQRQGMKPAGTRKSPTGSIRKHSSLTWMSVDDNSDNDNDNNTSTKTVHKMTHLAKALFLHEAISEYVTTEDLQIAQYDPKGCFHTHHDGFHRVVTVLTYLNGIGGTYFPLASCRQQQDSDNHNHNDKDNIQTMLDCHSLDFTLKIQEQQQFLPGRDGIVVIGEEGLDSYYYDDDNNSTFFANENDRNPNSIVKVQAGDALVFYNYAGTSPNATTMEHVGPSNESTRDWRSFHAGLPVTQEKWIATNWFRSEMLTGPFARLYMDRLLLENPLSKQ